MNLAFEPWIPVTQLDGKPIQASILDIFINGYNYADFYVRPHERIALMRLLICIGNAALDGPDESSELDEVADRLSSMAKEYLEKIRTKFDLFHKEYPFLQCIGISRPSKKNPKDKVIVPDSTPLSKLNFNLATGNNSTLFDHLGASQENRMFSAQEQALALLTFQCFSTCGTSSQVTWGDYETPKCGVKAAPCTPSSMLHTFIRGSNLRETIINNLLTKSQIEEHYGVDRWGKPIWEMPPYGRADDVAIENATMTYLGRLVPLSRLILLLSGGKEILLGEGLRYPTFPQFPAEPSATTVKPGKDGEENKLMGAKMGKAIWRELHALSIARKKDSVGGALALANLPEKKACDLWIGTLITKGKADIIDTLESVCHLPSGMRLNKGLLAYHDEIKKSENIAIILGKAIEKYREHTDGGWRARLKKDRWLRAHLIAAATSYYWTTIEKHRDLLISYVELLNQNIEDAIAIQKKWRKAIYKSAIDAYRVTCLPHSAREQRAFVLGLSELNSKPAVNISIGKTELSTKGVNI